MDSDEKALTEFIEESLLKLGSETIPSIPGIENGILMLLKQAFPDRPFEIIAASHDDRSITVTLRAKDPAI